MGSVTAPLLTGQPHVDVHVHRHATRGPLGTFTDERGREREVVCRAGAGGSRLIIDRLAGEQSDERLIAHLSLDEPPANAQLVADLYLADPRGRRCRSVTGDDLTSVPAEGDELELPECENNSLIDERGREYRLVRVSLGLSIPEVRWQRRPPEGEEQLVTVRDAIGSLERYEPVRTLTARALGEHGPDPTISTTALRAEMRRVALSPIVLNRGLREAALAAVARGATLQRDRDPLRAGQTRPAWQRER